MTAQVLGEAGQFQVGDKIQGVLRGRNLSSRRKRKREAAVMAGPVCGCGGPGRMGGVRWKAGWGPGAEPLGKEGEWPGGQKMAARGRTGC